MNTPLRFFIIFLVITGATSILIEITEVQFGTENFWDIHGVLFLISISIFPRLTLLFSSVPFGGLFWWLGFFLFPRILIATLATISYWQQNPILVIISWFIALSGESGEKVVITRKMNFSYSKRDTPKSHYTTIETTSRHIDQDNP